MRVLVGVQGGPVKVVRCEDGKVLQTFDVGVAGTTAAVEAMLWAAASSSERFFVAAAGRIFACNLSDGTSRAVAAYAGGACRLLANIPGNAAAAAGDVLCVSEAGDVRVFSAAALLSECEEDCDVKQEPVDDAVSQAKLPGPVHGACVGVWESGVVVASGGKHNDVAVHSLHLQPSVSVSALWKAKKRPGDPRTRAPDLVWPTAIAFVPDAPRMLAVASSYGDVRLYDTSGPQRRPIARVAACERPLTCLAWMSQQRATAVVGSAVGDVLQVDLAVPAKARVVGGFHGIGGSVRAVWAGNRALLCCGIDRYLHAFSLRTRARMSRMYLKQIASAMLVVSEDPDATDDDTEAAAAARKRKTAEELWTSLAEMPFDQDAPKSKRKHSAAAVEVDVDEDEGEEEEPAPKPKPKPKTKKHHRK